MRTTGGGKQMTDQQSCPRSDSNVRPQHEPHDPLHDFEGELAFREPQHRPASKCRLEVFLDVRQKSLCPVVPALNPDSALDFDQSAAWDVSEVGSPAAAGVEDEFLFQDGAVCRSPEDSEPCLQAGW